MSLLYCIQGLKDILERQSCEMSGIWERYLRKNFWRPRVKFLRETKKWLKVAKNSFKKMAKIWGKILGSNIYLYKKNFATL